MLDIDALETSFDLVAPRGEELVDLFYTRLFEAAPAVQPLFAHADARRQKAMLLSALVMIRKALRDLESIIPSLHALGARHVGYGALPEHYPVVGAVLIGAMAEVAGDQWRWVYDKAWAEAFDLIADAMLEGARSAGERLAA